MTEKMQESNAKSMANRLKAAVKTHAGIDVPLPSCRAAVAGSAPMASVVASLGVPVDQVAAVVGAVGAASRRARVRRVKIPVDMRSRVMDGVHVALQVRKTKRRILEHGLGGAGCCAAFDTGLVGILCDSEVLDPPFYEALLDLHAAGVAPRQVLAAFADGVEQAVADAVVEGADEEVADAVSVAAYEFARALRAAPTPDAADAEDLSTVGMALAYAFVDEHVDDADRAEAVLASLHRDAATMERAGTTLADIAVAVSATAFFHPLAFLVNRRLLEPGAAAVDAAVPAAPYVRRIECDVCDREVVAAAEEALDVGVVGAMWDAAFDNSILDDGMVRKDGSLALVSDVLVSADVAGLTLADLAAAVKEVFSAGLAVGAARDFPQAAAARRRRLSPDVDCDLAAVAVFGRWPPAAARGLVRLLKRMHDGGVALSDLCAQALVTEAIDDDGVDDGLMETMESEGLIVAPAVVDGDVSQAVGLVAAALCMGDPKGDHDRFLTRLKAAAGGWSKDAHGAPAEADAAQRLLRLSSGRVSATTSLVIDALRAVESIAPQAEGARGDFEAVAMSAGIALGTARFLCVDPDEADDDLPPAYRISAAEIAYIALADLSNFAGAPSSVVRMTGPEAAVVSAARATFANMGRVMELAPDRLAEVAFFVGSRDAARESCCSTFAGAAAAGRRLN